MTTSNLPARLDHDGRVLEPTSRDADGTEYWVRGALVAGWMANDVWDGLKVACVPAEGAGNDLPDWDSCDRALTAGNATPLQKFIGEYEPSGEGDGEWRDALSAAISDESALAAVRGYSDRIKEQPPVIERLKDDAACATAAFEEKLEEVIEGRARGKQIEAVALRIAIAAWCRAAQSLADQLELAPLPIALSADGENT
jgi:hypothetical protein